MYEAEQILARYKEKILGIRNYEAEKSEFYASDFTNLDTLLDFMWEQSTGESDLSPAGLAFLKEYYDMPELAESFLKTYETLPPHGEGKTDEDKIKLFVDYINVIEPMELALWVAESEWEKDKVGEKPSLDNIREDFLPPDTK